MATQTLLGRHGNWAPDRLGPDWSMLPIPLGSDLAGEPPPVATLVRHAAAGDPSRPAILYIHGYVDYFFQDHLGQYFAALGYAFYAIDLRRHGRSLQPGETPNYVTDLSVYREELDVTTRLLRDVIGHPQLTVLGHSTGGLVAALWANHRSAPGPQRAVDSLVLNSPWLDLQGSCSDRHVLAPLVDTFGGLAPRAVVAQLGAFYGPALHRDTGGEWDYDLRLKPNEGFPIRAGWLRAVRAGHRLVEQGLNIECPVLVLAAAHSGDRAHWHPDLTTTDSVLDAEQIVARAPLLGPDVTVQRIEAGAHDLALSPEPARSTYLAAVSSWLAQNT